MINKILKLITEEICIAQKEGQSTSRLTSLYNKISQLEDKKEETRNSKLLKEFTDYAEKHPSERFFQALRNWMEVPFILIANHIDVEAGGFDGIVDTFYIEALDKKTHM